MISEITVFAITLVILCSANNHDLNLCNSNETIDYTNYTTTRTESCGCVEQESCVRTCCQRGFVYVFDEQVNASVCIKNSTSWDSMPIYEGKNKKYDQRDNFIIGMLNCTGVEKLRLPPYFDLDNSIIEERYYVQENGTLYFPFSKYKFYNNSRYCVDEVKGVYVCWSISSDEDPSLNTSRKLNGLGMIISLPFLVATLIVVAVTRKSSVHKKALILFVLTLSLAYSVLIGIEFYPYHIPFYTCSTIGYGVLFFLLASFLWLNVIYLDIFTLSDQRRINRRGVSENNFFIFFSLYAWGITVILILIMLLLDIYGDEDASWYPGIGHPRCFIRNGLPQLIFLYLPIVLLIAFNFTLFVLTVLNIRKAERETSSFKSKDSRDADKDRHQLYLRLLFGTGINWGMEVVSFITVWVTGQVHFVVLLMDMLNAMYGIFVFFIFAFKEEHWRFLKKRCCLLFKEGLNPATSTGSLSSNSSTDTVLTEHEPKINLSNLL